MFKGAVEAALLELNGDSQPSVTPVPGDLMSLTGLHMLCVPTLHMHAGLRVTGIFLCFESSLLVKHSVVHLQSRIGCILMANILPRSVSFEIQRMQIN